MPAGDSRPNSAGVRKKSRPLLKGFIVLVVLLVIALFALPRIASPIVKSQLSRTLSDGSEVDAETVRVRWFSPTKIEGLTLTRPDGVKTLDLDITSTASAFGFLTDWMNAGEITITGEGTAPRSLVGARAGDNPPGDDADSATAPDEPIIIPANLRALVKIDRVRIRVESPDTSVASPTVTINGTAKVDGSNPVAIDIDADGSRGALDLGSASIDATIDSIITTAGVVTPKRAAIDAQIKTRSLDTAILGPLLGPDADATALFGKTLDVDVVYNGSPDAGRGKVDVQSAHLTADAAFELKDNVLTTTKPAHARADASAVGKGHAALTRALERAGVTLTSAPDATLTVPRLSIAIPGEGKTDLRTLALEATLELGSAGFSVDVPQPAGPDDAAPTTQARSFTSRPGTVRVAFDGGAQTANLNADLAASVDGSSDAMVTARLVFADLLDSNGNLRIDALAWPAGNAEIRGLPTALAQPFLEDTAFVLTQDVGPLLDLQLGRDQASGQTVTITANASNLRLNAQLERSGNTIRARQGATITLNDPGPLANRLLAPKEAGTQPSFMIDPGPLSVRFDRCALDTENEMRGQIQTWLILDATASLGRTTLHPADAPDQSFTLEPAEFFVRMTPVESEAQLRIAEIRSGGAPVLTQARVNAVLTEGFGPGSRIPVVLTADGLSPELARVVPGAAAAETPLRTLGESLTLSIQPTLVLDERFDITGPIEITGSEGSLRGRIDLVERAKGTLALEVRDGSSLARALGTEEEQARLLTGPAKANATFDLARPGAGAPAQGTAKITANARGLASTTNLTIGGNKGSFDLAATLSDPNTIAALLGMEPDAVRTALGDSIEIEGDGSFALRDGYALGDSGKAKLAAAARGLTASADATLTKAALVADVRAKVDDGQVLERVVGAFRELPAGLLREGVGDNFDARTTLSLARDDAGSINADRASGEIRVTSQRLRTREPIAFERTPERTRLTKPGELTWTVTPALIAALVPAEEDQPAPVTLIKPTEVRLAATRLDLPAGERASPDAAVELVASDIPVRLADAVERTYTGLRIALEPATGTSGRRAPGAIMLTATLNEGEREVLRANLESERLGEKFAATGPGAVRPALTGNVTLDRFDTAVIDAFATDDGTVGQFLGSTVSANIDLDGFPADGGTVRLSTTSPHADLTYSGTVEGDTLVASGKPRTVVRHIDSEFGFKIAKFLPIAGTLVKNAETDQPAYLETDTFVFPIDGDNNKINLDARVDIGTGRLQFEQRFIRLLDKRIVERGRSIGDSFEPFRVTMTNGVFETKDLVFPIGEFDIPASIKKDYPNNKETQRLSLPAGAVAAEAIRGQGVAANLLGSIVNVDVKSSGPIDADDSKLDIKVDVDEKQLIKDGIGEGLRNLFDRD